MASEKSTGVNAEKSARPRLLVISFSRIAGDARVMRQINEFVGDYEVTSCGDGPQPHPEVRHIELTNKRYAWRRRLTAILLRLKLRSLAYATDVKPSEARRKLRGSRFDAVIANDLTAVGVALSVAPGSRVHADLHEYWPGILDQSAQWRKLWVPFYTGLLRKHVGQVRSVTTVNQAIAQRYRDEFGFQTEVVANAGEYQDLEPVPVGSPLRLVHSGGVNVGRRIDVMMRAVAASSNDVTLDLYLTGVGSGEHTKLVGLADELGDRIRVLPPVPQRELVATLNQYDVGVHVLAPTCTNNRLALPNKFFDFVQARLAMVIGPTEAMADILSEYELGIVTDDFDEESITRTIDRLTAENVSAFKRNAHDAARPLGSEPQVAVWRSAIERIAPGKSA